MLKSLYSETENYGYLNQSSAEMKNIRDLCLLLPGRGAKYCDHSVSVCLSACMSVCSHLKNHVSKLHEIFCTCYMWPWLDPPMTTLQYIRSYVLPVLWMT